jgi:hypothetical protein
MAPMLAAGDQAIRQARRIGRPGGGAPGAADAGLPD